jgi:hypothetical protein
VLGLIGILSAADTHAVSGGDPIKQHNARQKLAILGHCILQHPDGTIVSSTLPDLEELTQLMLEACMADNHEQCQQFYNCLVAKSDLELFA